MKATLALLLIALLAISAGVYSARISTEDFKNVEKDDAYNAKFAQIYERALEISDVVAKKRSIEQSDCKVPTGLVYCTNINYASTTDASYEQLYFSELFNQTFNDDPDCSASFKNLICSIIFRGCDMNGPDGSVRYIPPCRSQCIDFSTKCAALYTGGICTDTRHYAPDGTTACTKVISAPLPTCSFPSFDLGSCSSYVTYTTPTGPNSQVNAQLQSLTTAYFFFVNYTIQAALMDNTTTPAQAETCFQAYQRMLCRYIFLECTGGDPFQINLSCDLTCPDLYFACPFMRPTDYTPPSDGVIDDSCGLVLPGCKPLPIGFTYGDPHFQTLDGAPFEFNALGEFTIAQSTDSDAVEIQARFEKCKTGMDATCTTAAAVKGYSHTVRLYSSSTTVTLRVDSSTLDISTTQFPYSIGGGELVILREAGTMNFEIQAKNSLSLQYRLEEGFTMIGVGAGSGLASKLQGFYGNFDGLRANDFVTKDGITINFPATAAEIFTWGRTWRVSEANSAFDYDGTTYATINNDAFTPSFSDNGMTFSSQASTACEGLGDQFYRACLFDVTVSGDANFARASVIAQSRIQQLTDNGSQNPTANEPVAQPAGSAATTSSVSATAVLVLATVLVLFN